MFRRDRNTLFFIVLGFSSMIILMATDEIDTILSYILLGITICSFILALIATDMSEFEKKPKKDEEQK